MSTNLRSMSMCDTFTPVLCTQLFSLSLSVFSFKHIVVLWLCANWLAMSNSCHNPFIYGFCSVSELTMIDICVCGNDHLKRCKCRSLTPSEVARLSSTERERERES